MANRRLLGCLFAAACQQFGVLGRDEAVVRLEPQLLIDPSPMAFGAASKGEVRVGAAWVENTGQALLDIREVRIEGSPDFRVQWNAALPLSLGAGQRFGFTVVYEPSLPGDQEAELVVVSDAVNADARDEVRASLWGQGLVGSLVVEPASWDAGTVFVGCEAWTEFRLRNEGTGPLDVSELAFTGGEGFTAVEPLSTPFEILPGHEVPVSVGFLPQVDGDRSGALTVVHDGGGQTAPLPVTASARWQDERRAEIITPNAYPATLLFAVDQSGSMEDTISELQGQFDRVVDVLRASGADWRVGVVTLDSGCVNYGVLTPGTPNLDAVFAEATEAGGADVMYTEALLHLTDLALLNAEPGGCNEGLMTPWVPLHAIVVSDEPDQSPFGWSVYRADWARRYGDPGRVRVHAVVDPLARCGLSGAAGYTEIANASGGRVMDLCAFDWADELLEVAAEAVQLEFRIPISGLAVDPTSIAVTVNGVPWVDGWVYDVVDSVVLLDETVPPGSHIVATWRSTEDCPFAGAPLPPP